MKHIYLNLKRFDIPKERGGVNSIAPIREWGKFIICNIQEQLKGYGKEEVEFAVFFPEAHLIPAVCALHKDSPVKVGCQGVYREDTEIGGNFGAFTSSLTANAVSAMGVTKALIGHCEERKDKLGILSEAGVNNTEAVNRILNREVKRAVTAGLSVVYCIGESAEEQVNWRAVLKEQLMIGLASVDKSRVTVAYEPVWAIGPGRLTPDKEAISRICAYIKELTDGCDVIYGGGLKAENAKMLSSVPGLDGGLIALTRFSGDMGFYPEEYLEIVKSCMGY